MSAALHNLKALSALHKTAIIGDMFELGEESAAQHEKVAKLASQLEIEDVVFIGKYFYALKDRYSGQFFGTPAEASAYLKANPIKDNLVLLKGSRGMALEQLLPLL